MSRIALATIAFLIGFTVYVVAAVTLADHLTGLHWSLQAVYFLIAGLLWTLPTRWLMFWAARR